MSAYTYLIEGNVPLKGEVTVGGSETLGMYLIAAALLTSETCIIKNVPQTRAIVALIECIKFLGVKAEFVGKDTLSISAQHITTRVVPTNLAEKVQESALLLGPLLARFSRASIGNISFGEAPTQSMQHVLSDLATIVGTMTQDADGFLTFQHHKSIAEHRLSNTLPLSAVVVLLSQVIGTSGSVVLKNMPLTHEMETLIAILQKMGADITPYDTGGLLIQKTDALRGFETQLFGDPDEVAFWAIAAAATHGDVTIAGFETDRLTSLYSKFTKLGIRYRPEDTLLHVWRESSKLHPVEITSKPYTGFIPRWIPWITTLLAQGDGVSTIEFSELSGLQSFLDGMKQFGVEYELHTDPATEVVKLKIFGPVKLHAAQIQVNTLENGCAYLLAAMAATDTTTITSALDIDTCFDTLIGKAQRLGARI